MKWQTQEKGIAMLDLFIGLKKLQYHCQLTRMWTFIAEHTLNATRRDHYVRLAKKHLYKGIALKANWSDKYEKLFGRKPEVN